MPRIPSAAEVRPIGGAASRLAGVRAGAADFGLATARGLEDLVGGLAASKPLLRQLAEADKKTDAAEETAKTAAHRVELREAAMQMVDNWAYDGTTPREAAVSSARGLEAEEDSRLREEPPGRRVAMKAATAEIRQGQVLRVAQRAQNARVAALNRKTERMLQLLKTQAVREPQAAAQYAAEGEAQLQALFEVGALSGEQRAARSEAFRRELYTAVVRGQPAMQAMADLQDGVYEEALGDPGLKRFLMQETSWRVKSEIAQGSAAVEAQLARLRRGDPVPSELSGGPDRMLAAGDLADAELRAEVALRARAELQSLRFAPDDEVEAQLAAPAPQNDAPDAAARARLQEEIRVQSRAMLRERRADPAAYVMEQPAVAAAFAAADTNPLLLSDAVTARLAAQEAMGLAPDEQNALTRAERDQIVAALQHLEPRERLATLMDLGKTYGAQSSAVAADLAAAGLSTAEVLVADPSADPAMTVRLAAVFESQGDAMSTTSGLIEAAVERLMADVQAAGGSRT